MSCFAPVSAWYTKEIGKTGKRQITFSRSLAHFPSRIVLPCGKCLGCLQTRARAWAIRCEHERKLHKENCFITLTYDPAKIPKGHTLVKRDLTLFLKRLRKSLEPKKVRFYACGEYGTKTGRPHYHILLFGWDAPAADRRRIGSDANNPLFNSVTVSRAWPLGHAVLGACNISTCQYVASYLAKDAGCKRQLDVHCADGEIIRLQTPFSVMSRNPGIGAGYVDLFHPELLAHDDVIVNGKPMSFPRYYDQRLIKKEYQTPEQLLEIKDSRRREQRRHKTENYPDRRRAREQFEILKLKHFQKGDL